MNDASLVTFALSNLNLRLGTPTVGLQIGPGGTIGIASIAAPAPKIGTDTRSWTAVVGANLAVSLSLPGITGSVSSGSLKINRAAGALNGSPQTGANALNWATDDATPAALTVDLNGAGDWAAPVELVDPGKALPTPVAMPVTLRGAQTAVAGTLSNLNLFDFITGGANFALSSQSVDVDLDGNGNAATGEQLNDATLLTVALSDLSLFVGIDGVGLELTGGSIGIGVISAPVVAGDTRSWTAVSANNVGVRLELPEITAMVSEVSLRIGRASGLKSGVPAAPLNWNTAIDLDPAGGFISSGLVNPGATLPSPINLTITQNGDSLAISGKLTTLNAFNFIRGSANFSITRQAVDVDLDGDGNAATGVDLQLNDAGLLTIGLDQLNVSIGGAGTGLSVTSGTLGIAILSAPVPTSGTDTRSWTAITGKDIAIALQVPGITANVVQGSVVVNRASGDKNGTPASEVNWVKEDLTTNGLVDLDPAAGYIGGSAPIDPGKTLSPVATMPITFRGRKLAVAGRLTNLSIFDLISGSADFALETRTVDVDFDGSAATTNDRLAGASLMTFGLSNLTLSVGLGGVGLSITGGSLGIATITPTAATAPATDNRSWSAVTGKDLAITLNIPGIQGSVTSGSVRINRASGQFDPTPANPTSGDEVKAVALNWATAAGSPLTVDLNTTTGWQPPTALVDPGSGLPDPTAMPITFRGSQLAVAGSITGLNLFGILTGGADFSVTSQLVDIDFNGSATNTTDRLNDASLVTFALSNLNLRLGTDTAGLQIGPGGTVGIASISAPAPATGTGADNRTWTAVVGKDLAVSLTCRASPARSRRAR